MEEYRKEILTLWTENKELDIFQLSPLTYIPNSINFDTLVIGINPSNSFHSLKKVINSHLNEWNSKPVLEKIKTEEDYQKFLMFKNFHQNEILIHDIQKYCHESHYHFYKQKYFLKESHIQKYDFLDLFPIWEIKQAKLIENLSKSIQIEKHLTSSFINYLKRCKFIRLIFLNKSSFEIFSKYYGNLLEMKSPLRINTGGVYSRIILSGILNLDDHKSKIYVVGIGGRNNNVKLINEINNIQFFKN